MGQFLKPVCERKRLLTENIDGEYYCGGKKVLRGFLGCVGEGLAELRDPDFDFYCTSCQKIEYTCTATGSVVHNEDACPPGGESPSDQFQPEAWREARIIVGRLFLDSCTILTPGIYKDWVEERQKLAAKSCRLFVTECETNRNEWGVWTDQKEFKICPKPGEMSWENSGREFVKGLVDRPCLVIEPPLAQAWLASYRAESKEVSAVKDLTIDQMLQETVPLAFFKSARAHYGGGKSLAQDWEAMVRQGEADFQHHAQLIELYIVHGRLDKARAALKFLQSLPMAKPEENWPALAYLMGEIFVAEEKFKTAEEYFTAHLEKAPFFPEIYTALGYLHLKLGNAEKARQMFAKVEENPKWRKGILLKVARTYFQRGEWDKATVAYQRLLELSGSGAEKELLVQVHHSLGTIAWIQAKRLTGKEREEKLTKARGAFEKAQRAQPDNPDLLYDYASWEFEEGRFEAALKKYEQVLALEPGAKDILYGKAQCLEKMGRKAEAHQIFEKLARGNKPYPKALLKLVEVYYWKGEAGYPLMRKAGKEAVKWLPEDFTAHFQLAEAHRFNQEFDDAVREYWKAKRWAEEDNVLTENQVGIYFGVGDSLVWKGELEAAHRALQTIDDQLKPESPVEWDRLFAAYKILKEEGIVQEEQYARVRALKKIDDRDVQRLEERIKRHWKSSKPRKK